MDAALEEAHPGSDSDGKRFVIVPTLILSLKV